MLERLNGIFALAIWDDERRELFLARDRLGVKPLYYAQRDGTLYFASEVKALLQALPRRRLRRDAVADYLTFLWVPDPDTIFEGVYKLPPGHFATYSQDGLRIQQFWDVSFAPEELPEDEWADAAGDGGLLGDPAADDLRRPARQLPERWDRLERDRGARPARSRTSSRPTRWAGRRRIWRTRSCPTTSPTHARWGSSSASTTTSGSSTPDIVELLPKLVWHLDEPVADPAVITSYLICSAARERLTVILSGMGGDEVFAGYPRHLAAKIGRMADVLPAARAASSAARSRET